MSVTVNVHDARFHHAADLCSAAMVRFRPHGETGISEVTLFFDDPTQARAELECAVAELIKLEHRRLDAAVGKSLTLEQQRDDLDREANNRAEIERIG